MAKRFTDTDKYKKPFIRGLKGAYKLLWDYLYHDCNHAGIWIVDFDIAQIYLGSDMQVNKEDALKYFNKDEERVIEFEKGKWFIPSFIDFQYGELSQNNRAHNSVINILSKNNLINNKGLVRGLYDPKDKDKDKNMDKDMDMDKYKCDEIKKEGTLHNIEKLINVYLDDERLCDAVISNKDNGIKDKTHLNSLINEFSDNLKEQGRFSETWKEFTRYFLNWVKSKNKNNPKGEDITKQLKRNIAY